MQGQLTVVVSLIDNTRLSSSPTHQIMSSAARSAPQHPTGPASLAPWLLAPLPPAAAAAGDPPAADALTAAAAAAEQLHGRLPAAPFLHPDVTRCYWRLWRGKWARLAARFVVPTQSEAPQQQQQQPRGGGGVVDVDRILRLLQGASEGTHLSPAVGVKTFNAVKTLAACHAAAATAAAQQRGARGGGGGRGAGKRADGKAAGGRNEGVAARSADLAASPFSVDVSLSAMGRHSVVHSISKPAPAPTIRFIHAHPLSDPLIKHCHTLRTARKTRSSATPTAWRPRWRSCLSRTWRSPICSARTQRQPPRWRS